MIIFVSVRNSKKNLKKLLYHKSKGKNSKAKISKDFTLNALKQIYRYYRKYLIYGHF